MQKKASTSRANEINLAESSGLYTAIYKTIVLRKEIIACEYCLRSMKEKSWHYSILGSKV